MKRAILIVAVMTLLQACAYTPPPAPTFKGEFSAVNPEYRYTPPAGVVEEFVPNYKVKNGGK